MTRIAGIDGCKAGWLRIEENLRTGERGARVLTDDEVFADADAFSVLAIDIPIGLSERDPRPCDVAARKLLRSPRASSVFPAPVRAVLGALTYEDALVRSRAAAKKGLSKQAFAITAKIHRIDRWLQESPGLQARVREVHPEVCFYYLAGERPMTHGKKTVAGAAERDALLTAVFGSAFSEVRAAVPRAAVANDDIRDALVALWTARRIAGGVARTVPAEPSRDPTGLRMEMVV